MAKKKNPDVGYGCPPVEHQFKPGQSGNPRGRPKGSSDYRTVIAKAMNERVSIVVNGRKKTLTAFHVSMKQLTRKAMSGDPRCMQLMFGLLQLAQPGTVNTVDPLDTPDDRALLADLAKRMKKESKDGSV